MVIVAVLQLPTRLTEAVDRTRMRTHRIPTHRSMDTRIWALFPPPRPVSSTPRRVSICSIGCVTEWGPFNKGECTKWTKRAYVSQVFRLCFTNSLASKGRFIAILHSADGGGFFGKMAHAQMGVWNVLIISNLFSYWSRRFGIILGSAFEPIASMPTNLWHQALVPVHHPSSTSPSAATTTNYHRHLPYHHHHHHHHQSSWHSPTTHSAEVV